VSGPRVHAEAALTVASYLDAGLVPYARMSDLASLADKAAARPLADLLEDLRGVLRDRGLEGADGQRLHVLLSHLYHASPDVDGDLLDLLRTEVDTAWQRSRGFHRDPERR
jgi:hypothetical protein